jgi:DNA-binding HxlR family transcriptional regulator
MLSVRLNELEEENFITRHDFGQSPPRVEYRSTEASAALRPVFDALLGWARIHAPEIVPPRNRALPEPATSAI